ncbi:MAG TPA: glycoside hydrolase family 32 protein [Puia sp.]|nr:glycoside hydrolase family 32 protein [Puia sp.]
MKYTYPLLVLCVLVTLCAFVTAAAQAQSPANSSGSTAAQSSPYKQPFRPQIHFSQQAHWMNDPNGMVYYKGTYHLFFQYYPKSTVWGPMHWGHATSTDLVHWREQPIALYPDSLGYIFSGSAVVDIKNTSGFGRAGQTPLVAIFTHHDPKGADAGRDDFQNQSLAYSLDDGVTWKKYAGNPVLKNPGIVDFRDPKVMWYPAGNEWIMTLATRDRIAFYSSPDLKHWKKESEFGKELGAHGGVWECPDLFPLDDNGKKVWVLIVNINPGGPNRGSATQYFLGRFDGHVFTPGDTTTRWLDYGPDEYAGVTWGNTGERRIFLGWMSNWLYANQVPTVQWRNAMTVPRELTLRHAGKELFVTAQPIHELEELQSQARTVVDQQVSGDWDLSSKVGPVQLPCRLTLRLEKAADFSLAFSNNKGEQLVLGYDVSRNSYFIDRAASGSTDFQKDFTGRHWAPRLSDRPGIDWTLIADVSSVELFADNGLSVMTEIFFPEKPYTHIHFQAKDPVLFKKISYTFLAGIWP